MSTRNLRLWASDIHFLREGLLGGHKNLRFATVLNARRARSDERVVSRSAPPNLPRAKKE